MNINMQAQAIIIFILSANLLCHSLKLRLESWNKKQENASGDIEWEAPLSSLIASLVLALTSIAGNCLVIWLSTR